MPSMCQVCGNVYCDHSAEERGQTKDEMMRSLSPEEEKAWQCLLDGSSERIAFAKAHAHDPVPVAA